MINELNEKFFICFCLLLQRLHAPFSMSRFSGIMEKLCCHVFLLSLWKPMNIVNKSSYMYILRQVDFRSIFLTFRERRFYKNMFSLNSGLFIPCEYSMFRHIPCEYYIVPCLSFAYRVFTLVVICRVQNAAPLGSPSSIPWFPRAPATGSNSSVHQVSVDPYVER